MKFILTLLLASWSVLAAQSTNIPAPIAGSRLEAAVRAGPRIHQLIPNAAKVGEKPDAYGSPGVKNAKGNPHPGSPPYGKKKD